MAAESPILTDRERIACDWAALIGMKGTTRQAVETPAGRSGSAFALGNSSQKSCRRHQRPRRAIFAAIPKLFSLKWNRF